MTRSIKLSRCAPVDLASAPTDLRFTAVPFLPSLAKLR